MPAADIAQRMTDACAAAQICASKSVQLVHDLDDLSARIGTQLGDVLDVRIGPMQAVDCITAPTPLDKIQEALDVGALVMVQTNAAIWYVVEEIVTGPKLNVLGLDSQQRRTIMDPVREVIRVRWWVKSGA